VLPAPPRHWVGNGFHVYPVFHDKAFTAEVSPWLMFDYGAPKEFSPTTSRRGVGQHPHRGFETVTIAFQGEVEHGDSVGNRDVIGPGDVQWMTAARGVVHEEFHSTEFSKKGGTFEMAQLWLNLPKAAKMGPPRYQAITKATIPQVFLGGESCGAAGAPDDASYVRVIAGSFQGNQGPAQTTTPVELWDIYIATQGEAHELPLPDGHTAIVFVREGSALVGPAGAEQELGPQAVALLDRSGDGLRFVSAAPGTKLLLLGGAPINEPIAARGPFVMNTMQEIAQANEDFHAGRLGR